MAARKHGNEHETKSHYEPASKSAHETKETHETAPKEVKKEKKASDEVSVEELATVLPSLGCHDEGENRKYLARNLLAHFHITKR
jgi:hypothetical protein